MNKRRRGTTILVPIDFHGINPATLDTLVRIARRLDRNLLGLILENPRLQRVADLPFTTEIVLSSGAERSLERDHLSRHHSHVAEDTRRRLRELAERDRIELAFEQDEGDRWHAALARDGGLDIFIPARRRWHRPAAPGESARPAVYRLGLMLSQGEFDEEVVATAEALVDAKLVGSVYVLATNALEPEVLQHLARDSNRCCVQSNLKSDPDSITALIRRSPYDLLILPRDCLDGIPTETLDAALEEAGGQVMVVS